MGKINFSIRAKIILITVAILCFAIGTNALISTYYFSRDYANALNSKAFIIGQNLKLELDRLLSFGILVDDLVGFEKQCLEIVNRYDDIVYARVIDTEGRILFHSDPTQHGKIITDAIFLQSIKNPKNSIQTYTDGTQQYEDFLVPFFGLNEEHLGAVSLGFPTDMVAKEATNLLGYSVVVTLISLSIAVVLLVVSVSTWVTNPLLVLVETIHQHRGSKTDADDLVRAHPKDEIKQLSSAFKQLMTELTGSQEKIKKYTYGLELKVEERTAALREINLQLEQDILERKQTEARLRESEQSFRVLFERSPDAVLLIDPHSSDVPWAIIDCNNVACRMNGYTRDELIGQPIQILNAQEDTPEEQLVYLDQLKQVEYRQFETQHRHKDGTAFPVEVSTCIISIAGRELVLGIDRDITERKRAEEALHLTRYTLEQMADAVYWIGSESQIIDVNEAACRMLGYTREELVQMSVYDIDATVSERDVLNVRETIQQTGTIIFEAQHRTKDGRLVPVEVVGNLIEYGDDELNCTLVRDITERKQAEEALAVANQELEQAAQQAKQLAVAAEAANRAKSQFLANMSHEIRTPMNAVIGMTSLLLDTPLTYEQRDSIETIRMSGDSLLTIINDILDFSKIEAGKLDLEQRPFILENCLAEALDLVAPKATDKELELAYVVEETPSYLIGDVTRLRQILVNLIGNAIKFTERGEVTISVSSVTYQEQDYQPDTCLDPAASGIYKLHFAVRDTGIGIPPDRMNRLFQSFSQVDASTTRQYGGTGLGLAISKRLSEIMGGTMWVESKGIPGKGSTFHFTILAQATPAPIADSLDAVQNPATDRATLALPPAGSKSAPTEPLPLRILLAEDNLINQKVASRLLERIGYNNIDIAANGIEVLQALQQQVYDVVFMDIQMPEMDGLEACRRICQDFPLERQPRIIAMTANAMQSDYEACMAAGMSDYISKPIRKEDLIQALKLCYPKLTP